jgi:hypothetical protein
MSSILQFSSDIPGSKQFSEHFLFLTLVIYTLTLKSKTSYSKNIKHIDKINNENKGKLKKQRKKERGK